MAHDHEGLKADGWFDTYDMPLLYYSGCAACREAALNSVYALERDMEAVAYMMED